MLIDFNNQYGENYHGNQNNLYTQGKLLPKHQ